MIDKPDHYKYDQYEPIKIAFAYDFDFCEGNVLKYLLRWKLKNGTAWMI